jgi:hypothetical protein
MSDVTYRLIALDPQCGIFGQTALTGELALLVPGGLNNPEIRKTNRLGIERTDWSSDQSGMLRKGLKPVRSVLADAESHPGEWVIGSAVGAAQPEPMKLRRI